MCFVEHASLGLFGIWSAVSMPNSSPCALLRIRQLSAVGSWARGLECGDSQGSEWEALGLSSDG